LLERTAATQADGREVQAEELDDSRDASGATIGSAPNGKGVPRAATWCWTTYPRLLQAADASACVAASSVRASAIISSTMSAAGIIARIRPTD
jgi:hypothetical protein